MRYLINDHLSIFLYAESAWRWFRHNNTFARGFIFYNGILLQDEDFAQFIDLLCPENIANTLKGITGCYSVIVYDGTKLYAFVDMFRSFPLFYMITEDEIDITDRVSERELRKGKIDWRKIDYWTTAMYIPGKATALSNCKQLMAGECLIIDSNGKMQVSVYNNYSDIYLEHNTSGDKVFTVLESALMSVQKQIETFVTGKTVLLPLSGGHDSRLILHCLNKVPDCKIIAYTYGTKHGNEFAIVKQLADLYKIPLYYIEYTRKKCEKFYETVFEKYALFSANAVSNPWMQELYALSELQKKGILHEDIIAVSGLAGDFFAGGQLAKLKLQQNRKYSSEEICRMIIDQRMSYAPVEEGRQGVSLQMMIKEILTPDEIAVKNLCRNDSEQLTEEILFREHIAKFILNGLRVYEFYGIKWYVPFLNLEWITQLINLDRGQRYERNAFFELEKKIYDKEMLTVPYDYADKEYGLMSPVQQIIGRYIPVDPIHSRHLWTMVYISKRRYRKALHKRIRQIPAVFYLEDYIKIIMKYSEEDYDD